MLTVTEGQECDWGNMPLDELAFGNAMDCDFTLRCYKKMRPMLKNNGSNKLYDKLLKRVLILISKVEGRGIRVDQDLLSELDVALIKEITSLKEVLLEKCPVKDPDLNLNSDLQMAGVLFTSDGFDLTPTMFTDKTHVPKLSEEHLIKVKVKCGDKDAVEFIDLLLKYKYRAKQHKTYIGGIRAALKYNGDGRVYSSYNFGLTVTGRLSCSTYSAGKDKKKGISFHTLARPVKDDPINIRKLMVADKGKVFLTADFSQAELRMLAQCCRDKNLMDAFNRGEDLHKFTASMVFDKPIDDITDEERQIAKSVSFLIVYGGGPFKLSEQIGKSKQYCIGIFNAYEKNFPKIFTWIKKVHKDVKADLYAESPFGRRRHLKNVKSPNKKYMYRALRQGMNSIIQSSASDLMLHAILRLQYLIDKTGVSAEFLATVHDSVELQCDVGDLDKVLQVLQYSLTSTEDFKVFYGLDFVVPFEVDIEVGHSFGDGVGVKFSPKGKVKNLNELHEYLES